MARTTPDRDAGGGGGIRRLMLVWVEPTGPFRPIASTTADEVLRDYELFPDLNG